jgi:hypothetical protein
LDTWVQWCPSAAMVANIPSQMHAPHKYRVEFDILNLERRAIVSLLSQIGKTRVGNRNGRTATALVSFRTPLITRVQISFTY